jgi:hypothetical protein
VVINSIWSVWEYGSRNILVVPCVDRVWRRGKLLFFLMMRKSMMIPIVRGIQKLPGCWEPGGGQSTCI